MKNLIELAKKEFISDLPHNGVYVDMLLGSGYEALYLAQYSSEGRVFSFGQGSDIDVSCKLFEAKSVENIRFINDSPENMEVYVSSTVNGAICRINSDSRINNKIIINAIKKLLTMLVEGGRLLFIAPSDNYSNVLEYLSKLSYKEFFVTSIVNPNDDSSPTSMIVEFRGGQINS